MKNKQLMYFLLPAAFLVWGIIIYKIVDQLNFDGDEINESQDIALFKIKKSISGAKETFELLVNYPDPFLKSTGNSSTIIENNTVPSKQIYYDKHNITPLSPTNDNVKKDVFVYIGIIENGKKSKRKVALLLKNGKSLILKEKERKDNIMIERIYRDSLKINVDGKSLIIKK